MEQSTSAEVAVPKRECILHVDVSKVLEKQARQDVNPFNNKNWAAVLAAVQNRQLKRNFEQSKYYGIILKLPAQPHESDGFHLKCYQKFTAVKSSTNVETDALNQSSNLRSLKVATTKDVKDSSTSGILPEECLFCGAKRKKKKDTVEMLGLCETLEAADNIKQAARKLQDDVILPKVSGIDLVAKEVKYHHSCKSTYLLKANRTSTTKGDEADDMKTACVVIKSMHEYVEKAIIVEKRPELLTSVYERYLDFCLSLHVNPIHKSSLMRNLTNKFGVRIKVHVPIGKKMGNILYSAEIADDAIRVAYDYSVSDERIITKAALLMRDKLLKTPKKDLPLNPTLNDLREGDASPPELVSNFFRILYTGKVDSNICGKRIERRVACSSQDVLFVVQRGKAIPAKHVTLGMAIKSVTGSKKLVTILNRFGYCLNYSALEELETATAEAIIDREEACPEDTVVGLPMGLAFDNFDEMTQTLSGKDTLHDTMGILYQNTPSLIESQPSSGEMSSPSPMRKNQMKPTKRRTLNVPDTPLMPYHGIPKMTLFNYKNIDVYGLPDVSTNAKQMDFLWVIEHVVNKDPIPMWVGFNAKTSSDHLPKQVVRYMPNLKQPITSLSVIHNTLITTQKCADECKQKYGVVSYDLNAAKPAMQIQVTEAPKFDNIFVMLGAFHVEMAFFKAVGKLINESGGPCMMTDTEVLATGSLNGFITGKHFNRCKRLHPILALAFKRLHFLAFLETYEEKDQLKDLLVASQTDTRENLDVITSDAVFVSCFKAYSEYSSLTRSGVHGVTAKYWYMYIEYINLYHQFERSIRTNNIDLFVYTLTPMIGLFFATNHINYSRWLTKFQLDLMNIEDTHPGLRDILEQGAFTVRRTNHPFSRIPVDLTLEQTINADAASRLTGISSITNSYNARLRWMATKSTRASFINLLEEMAGLINKEDPTSELRPRRIDRDSKDLQKIMKQIEDTYNPFIVESEPSEVLFNISTGKAVSNTIKESLLSVPETGKSRHQQFVETCSNDASKFESRITKSPLKTFADGGAKNRRSVDQKIARLVCTRDLMGRLLVLALKRDLDMQYVFQYPLTPVPLSMCNPDETMAKTDKSKLLEMLEMKVKGCDNLDKPARIDAYIIDGPYLLHVLPPNLPPTYGGLARSILIKALTSSASRVHLIFDDYPQPSLKDAERERRGIEERVYRITGPEQRRIPKDMSDALKSRSFKKQLPMFLADEWQSSAYAPVLGMRHLYLDVPGECFHFYVTEGVMRRDVDETLKSNHQEADTKIVIHAKAADLTQGNLVIRASDTDIAVILIHHSKNMKATLWMDTGTASKNNRRFINITTICKELGPNMCSSLLGFHAFTGCDYTSTFTRKGKIRPLEKLAKMPAVQIAFKELSNGEPSDTNLNILQQYTASLYGAKGGKNLNEYRYEKFEKGYSPKNRGRNPLANLRGIDATAIPPCESEINMHIKRVAFVTKMWAQADQVHLNQEPTENNGWHLVNGAYMPIWFEGKQLPSTLVPEDDKDIEDSDDVVDTTVISSSDEEDDENTDEED